jgi:enoyl-CoA hydratase
MYQNIIEDFSNQILTIIINRPDKLNALNKLTIEELGNALNLADRNKDVRVIIITGSGTKSFIAGADISEFAHFSIEEGKKLSAEGHHQLFNRLENMSKPVIAAINGFALGGGLELAMACHIRIASDNAKMGLPEVSLGVIPGYGGTQRLSQLVGRGKAMELITTADMMNANDALSCGLVNHVTTAENLFPKCIELAQKTIGKSPKAIAAAIRAINASFNNDVNGFEIEIQEFGNCFGTEDFKEGTSAFLEKRKANFSGN